MGDRVASLVVGDETRDQRRRRAVAERRLRRELAEALAPFGVKIDVEANNVRSGEPRVISAPDSTVTIYVFPTNEELAIARQALTFA